MFSFFFFFFFFNDTATTEIYTLSLHDALPIIVVGGLRAFTRCATCSGTSFTTEPTDRRRRPRSRRPPPRELSERQQGWIAPARPRDLPGAVQSSSGDGT